MQRFDHLRPWADDRQSLCAALRGAGSGDGLAPDAALIRELREAPLAVTARRRDLFSHIVEPVVEAIDQDLDVAALIVDLLERLLANPTIEVTTQLYQLLIDDSRYNFSNWERLATLLKASPAGADAAVRDLLTQWLEEAPDRAPIDAALFMLTRHRGDPLPIEVLVTLGRDHFFVSGVASTISVRFPAQVAEDRLIALAKQYNGTARTRILNSLGAVESPAHRDWLLTEGYDNGLDYETPAYAAATLGHLIERLRRPALATGDLAHHVRTLELMAKVAGLEPFFGYWWSINDYADGPEAIGLVIDHLTRLDGGPPQTLWNSLTEILYFLVEGSHEEAADGRMIWTPEVTAALAHRLRALLERAGVDPNFFWWERPDPTLADLQSGNLGVLNRVISDANGSGLEAVVDWAIDYLKLEAAGAVAAVRRQALLDKPLDGVRQGGLAGMTDEALGSEFAQVILQVLLRLRTTGLSAGWPLIRAGLSSNLPMLRQAALEVLDEWPDDRLPSGAITMLLQVLRHDPESAALQARLTQLGYPSIAAGTEIASQSTDLADLMTTDNLSVDLSVDLSVEQIRQILEADFMDCTATEEGAILVNGPIGIEVLLDREQRSVRACTSFAFSAISTMAQRLEAVNRINAEYLDVRCRVSDDRMWFEHEFLLERGLGPLDLVCGIRRFADIPQSAIEAHASDIVE